MPGKDLSNTAFENDDLEQAHNTLVSVVGSDYVPNKRILPEAYHATPDIKLRNYEPLFWVALIITSFYFFTIIVS